MANEQQAIAEAVKLSNNAFNMLNNIWALDRQAQAIKISGGKTERMASLDKQINEFAGDAANMITRARIQIEYAQEQLRHQNPNHPGLKLLQQKLNFLDRQAARLDQIQQRVVSRSPILKNDPTHEQVKSLPRASTLDPTMSTKIDGLVSAAFGDDGIIIDNSLASTLNKLDNSEEKCLFLKELAERILKDEHAQLNGVRALSQLAKPELLRVRSVLAVELEKITNERNAQAVPAKEPSPQQVAPKQESGPPAPPKPKTEAEQEFENNVKSAVEGGINVFKKLLAQIPTTDIEKRTKFFQAYKDELANQKVQAALAPVKVPHEAPARINSKR